MPDLNQKNPLVLNYLTQNAIWWIEYADLDGFRVDTYNYQTQRAAWTKSRRYLMFYVSENVKRKWPIGKRQ
jgi:glycosidase